MFKISKELVKKYQIKLNSYQELEVYQNFKNFKDHKKI